jgi:hypothetical protein
MDGCADSEVSREVSTPLVASVTRVLTSIRSNTERCLPDRDQIKKLI